MSHVDDFVNELFLYLSKSPLELKSGIIKRHTSDFTRYGEFSFPWSINSWRKYVSSQQNSLNKIETIFDITNPEINSIKESCDILIKISLNWPLKIDKCAIIKDRIHIYLDRVYSITKYLPFLPYQSINNETIKQNLIVSSEGGAVDDITNYRVNLLCNIIKKLAVLNKFSISNTEEGYHIHVSSKSISNKNENFNILCGPVLNAKTGLKETEVTTDQYVKKRTIDMKLKAQHKYRVLITDEGIWNKSLTELGEASVSFDLLQVKPSHSIVINMNDEGTLSSSKGASFILYNCARLSSIIQTFNENVKKGVYPPLPGVDAVDFSLLNDEDEWAIFFNYIFVYHSAIRNSFIISSDKCIVAPHQLCSFLSSLVGKFSVYYRRIRVLLEPREHLLPKIYARIHLLLVLREILTHALSLFNIKLLAEM